MPRIPRIGLAVLLLLGSAPALFAQPAPVPDDLPTEADTPPAEDDVDALLGRMLRSEGHRAAEQGRSIDALWLLDGVDPNDPTVQRDIAGARAQLAHQHRPHGCDVGCDGLGCDGCADSCYKPLRGRLLYGQYYDDNTGAFPTSNQFVGLLLVRPIESWGSRYRADVEYDLVANDCERLLVGGGLMHTDNYDASQFDLITPSVYTDYTSLGCLGGRQVAYGIRSGYSHTYLGSDEFLSVFDVKPYLTLIQSECSSVQAYYRYDLVEFAHQPGAATVFDQDSDRQSLGVTWSRLFPCANTRASLGYEVTFNDSEGDEYEYTQHGLLAGLAWQPHCKWTFSGTVNVYFREYDNNSFLFPGVVRDDHNYIVGATAQYHLRRNVDLYGRYVLNRNDSNLLTNDFERNLGEAGIEWRF